MKTFLAIILFASSTLARPEIGIEKKFENSREISAQQLTPITDSAHLPSVANTNEDASVMMFFPDYNAYLVPAEALYPNENQNVKRRRPMVNLIKLIQQRRVQTHQVKKNLTETGSSSTPEDVNVVSPNQKPLLKPTLKEQNVEVKPEESEEVKVEDLAEDAKGFTFPQVGQIFQQRPTIPVRPQFPINRPLISSYIPPGLTGWRPFGNLFQFQQISETPRDQYIHYLTKTPTLPLQQTHTYFFDEYTPRLSQISTYADNIQDYVSNIEESVMKEASTNSDDTSSMMLATLPVGENTPTSLLLRPIAKAVAGAKGVAVASPVAKAVLKKGEKVNIDFDPDAVAIAGPGGRAHAHPKLIISYSNETKQE